MPDALVTAATPQQLLAQLIKIGGSGAARVEQQGHRQTLLALIDRGAEGLDPASWFRAPRD